MPHPPLAHDVAPKQYASPDHPVEERAEAFQGSEFNVLAINPIPRPLRQTMGNDEIEAGNEHKDHARYSTQVQLGLQNGEIDEAVALLVKPQPIDQQVYAAE